MTILNNTSDGLHPELIVLFRAIAYLGKVEADELMRICLPESVSDTAAPNRLRGALLRWTEMGLFIEQGGYFRLADKVVKAKHESLDDFTNRLPSICRRLVLEEKNILPMWGESTATASDFSKGVTWLLAQNIYGFPSTWDEVEKIANVQLVGEKILQNDTRWNNLRFWARYFGFATGDSGSFQLDPTSAIKDELPMIFSGRHELPALEFLHALGERLPVLDFGAVRKMLEEKLNPASWRKPADGHLSLSLSLAMQRLDLSSTIKLTGKADAKSSYRLTGRNYRTWRGFESVIWNGGAK